MNNKAEFLEAIQLGMDIESACYLIGASPMSVYRLLERGKKEQERLTTGRTVKPRESEAGCMELWQEVTAARSRGMRSLIDAVRSASADDWKAAAFLLEKINPAVFASGGSVKELEAEPLGEIEGY